MDINNFLNGMDKGKLMNAIQSIGSTPQGRELMKKLKNVDKAELLSKINSFDQGKVSKEDLMRQLSNNPNLLKDLNDFLSKGR